jgi:CBS domain containing-hemolysin-like protein
MLVFGGGVLVVCLYLAFIAASLAIARSRVAILNDMREEGAAGAALALELVERADYYLLCAQFGRVISSSGIGFFLAVGSCLGASRLNMVASQTWVLTWGVLAVVVYVLAVLALIVAVQIVKSITLQYPERVLCHGGWLLRLYATISDPALEFAERIVGRVLGRWGVEATNERELRISAAELGEIVKVSSEAGTLESDEGQFLERVAELSERSARDVMTPRSEIVWVHETAASSAVIELCRRESVSRLLVCGTDLDDVRGVLLAKDLLAFAGVHVEPHDWRRFIRPAYRIPDTKVVRELLVELQLKRIHFSVVLNEHGEVVGVVTLEDLVEEIVGEIFDEFDQPASDTTLYPQNDGSLTLDGTASIETLAELYDIVLPDGEYHTIAGFVQDHLGRVPVVGDSFSVAGYTFVILELHRHRIARMAISKCPLYHERFIGAHDVAIGEA